MYFRKTFIVVMVSLLFSACGFSGDVNEEKTGSKVLREGAVTIDGFPLQYIRQGGGEPLLIIGSAIYYPRAFSKELESRYEMIYIDSRHFVPDCRFAEEELSQFDLQTFSDDVETMRRELGLKKVTVIGHSIHAQIAVDYAVRYPEHIHRLILIAGVPYVGDDMERLKEELWESAATEERQAIRNANLEIMELVLDTVAANRYFAESYFYSAPLYWADPNFDASELLADLRTCPQLFGSLAGSLPSKAGMIEKLEQLSVPTLVLLGKLDFAIPYKAWEEIIAENEQIDYILMEEASHNPHTEPSTVGAFNTHLIGWMAKQRHK